MVPDRQAFKMYTSQLVGIVYAVVLYARVCFGLSLFDTIYKPIELCTCVGQMTRRQKCGVKKWKRNIYTNLRLATQRHAKISFGFKIQRKYLSRPPGFFPRSDRRQKRLLVFVGLALPTEATTYCYRCSKYYYRVRNAIFKLHSSYMNITYRNSVIFFR